MLDLPTNKHILLEALNDLFLNVTGNSKFFEELIITALNI